MLDMTRSDTFEAIPLWRDQFLASTRSDGKYEPHDGAGLVLVLVEVKSHPFTHQLIFSFLHLHLFLLSFFLCCTLFLCYAM